MKPTTSLLIAARNGAVLGFLLILLDTFSQKRFGTIGITAFGVEALGGLIGGAIVFVVCALVLKLIYRDGAKQ